MPTESPKHRGIMVPVATPFNADGTVDEAAARGLVEMLALHGLHSFVLGTTGEAPSISHPERERLVKAAVEAAGGRALVYAGLADNCVADSLEAAEKYLSLGVDAVVAVLPSYYLLNADEMRAYFELLADRIAGPLVLYNIPPTTHMSVPVEVVESLSRRPNVIGFKDSENNVERMKTVAERLGGRDDFALFMGVAAHSVSAMRLGFDGSVPSSGNLAPAPWGQLWRAVEAQRWDEAAALQERLNVIGGVVQGSRSLGQSLAALKAAMSVRGLCQPHVLPPLQTLGESDVRELSAALDAVGTGDWA